MGSSPVTQSSGSFCRFPNASPSPSFFGLSSNMVTSVLFRRLARRRPGFPSRTVACVLLIAARLRTVRPLVVLSSRWLTAASADQQPDFEDYGVGCFLLGERARKACGNSGRSTVLGARTARKAHADGRRLTAGDVQWDGGQLEQHGPHGGSARRRRYDDELRELTRRCAMSAQSQA